jgi:hypothetical protein
MREIKFRGLTENGEWCYGLLSESKGYIGQPEKGFYISNSGGMPWAFQVRPETIGEYIGRKDKNKKEIFEGDICRSFLGEPTLGIIRYINCAFVFTASGIDWKIPDDLEIIGNICENPEIEVSK